MGPLSGQRREEGWATYVEAKRRWMAGDLDFTHERGESYAAIRRRVVPALQVLVQRHPGQTIVVVTHGVVIRVALTSLLEGHGPEDFDHFGIANTALHDLRSEGGRLRVAALNQARGIPSEETPGPEAPSY